MQPEGNGSGLDIPKVAREGRLIRKVLVLCFKIVFSGFLIGFLFHRIGVQRVAEHLRVADGWWLMGALVVFTLSNVVGSFQWWLLLRSEGISMGWTETLSLYFVGLFFNNFLISNVGGDVFRMVDVRRYSKNGSGAVATVFLDRFAGLLVLSGMAVLAAPWLVFRSDVGSVVQYPILALIAGWVFMLFFLFNRRFARSFTWLVRWAIPGRMTVKAKEVYEKINRFGRHKRLLVQVVGLSVVIQGARIMTHYLLGRSLGVTVSPVYFFLIIPIVAVVASLPVSLGGLGLREQTGVVLFGGVGVAALQAFSMEFLAYLVAVVSGLPGGVVFVSRKRVESDGEKGLSVKIQKGESP